MSKQGYQVRERRNSFVIPFYDGIDISPVVQKKQTIQIPDKPKSVLLYVPKKISYPKQNLTILTLNVQYFECQKNGTCHEMIQLIESMRPDVICAQEEKIGIIDKLRQYKRVSTCGMFSEYGNISNGVFVLEELANLVEHTQEIDIGEICNPQRCGSVIWIGGICIANVHLCGGRFNDKNFSLMKNEKKTGISKVISLCNPDIIVGDFNGENSKRSGKKHLANYDLYKSLDAENKKEFIKYYIGHMDELNEHGYISAYDSEQIGPTSSFGGNPDWIFYKHENVENPEKIINNRDFLKHTDHSGVMVTFTVNNHVPVVPDFDVYEMYNKNPNADWRSSIKPIKINGKYDGLLLPKGSLLYRGTKNNLDNLTYLYSLNKYAGEYDKYFGTLPIADGYATYFIECFYTTKDVRLFDTTSQTNFDILMDTYPTQTQEEHKKISGRDDYSSFEAIGRWSNTEFINKKDAHITNKIPIDWNNNSVLSAFVANKYNTDKKEKHGKIFRDSWIGTDHVFSLWLEQNVDSDGWITYDKFDKLRTIGGYHLETEMCIYHPNEHIIKLPFVIEKNSKSLVSLTDKIQNNQISF